MEVVRCVLGCKGRNAKRGKRVVTPTKTLHFLVGDRLLLARGRDLTLLTSLSESLDLSLYKTSSEKLAVEP